MKQYFHYLTWAKQINFFTNNPCLDPPSFLLILRHAKIMREHDKQSRLNQRLSKIKLTNNAKIKWSENIFSEGEHMVLFYWRWPHQIWLYCSPYTKAYGTRWTGHVKIEVCYLYRGEINILVISLDLYFGVANISLYTKFQ